MKIQSWYCGDDKRLRHFVYDGKQCKGRYDNLHELYADFPALTGKSINYVENCNSPVIK
jgi:hypothetical protein